MGQENKMKVEFKLPKSIWPVMGSHSLQGLMVSEDIDLSKVTEIHLLFQQSSEGFKRENRGPHELILPEHFPMVLCESILALCARGIKVSIGEYISDTK
jgi:hypothetical protein